MKIFDIFKKMGRKPIKLPSPKTPLELLENELKVNFDQFKRFQKDTEIGFKKAGFFKTEMWNNFDIEGLSETQTQGLRKAYELIQRMNEELSILEVEKSGYVKGNISSESKDKGQNIFEKTLNHF